MSRLLSVSQINLWNTNSANWLVFVEPNKVHQTGGCDVYPGYVGRTVAKKTPLYELSFPQLKGLILPTQFTIVLNIGISEQFVILILHIISLNLYSMYLGF